MTERKRKKTPFPRQPFACLALLLLAFPAWGDATGSSPFSFNGFGTLGITHSTEDRADFRTSLTQPDGAGYSHEFAFSPDSRLGLQMQAAITDQLSATVQIVSENQHDHTYAPEVEWANLKYAFTPDFSLRAGRIVLPALAASDYRKVGYAHPWVRPPIAVYSLVPISNSDGIDASYSFDAGSANATIQAFYGRKDFDIPKGGPFEARDLFGAFATFEYDELTLRGGYLQAELTAPMINELFDAFRAFGPAGETIANRYDVDGKRTRLATVGASYDTGDWFLRSEWVDTRADSFRGHNQGWYVGAGWRDRNFTHYATFSRRDKLNYRHDPGLDLAVLPPEAQPVAAFLNAQMNSLLDSNAYDTLSVGTRWDFREDFALKLQVDHFDLDYRSYGDLINAQADFEPGSSFTVFSLSVDFIF